MSPHKLLLLIGALCISFSLYANDENCGLEDFIYEPGFGNVFADDSLKDREGNFINDTIPGEPIDLEDPEVIEQNIEYDPETGDYIITETIGDQNYRAPVIMSFDEYWKQANRRAMNEYWSEKNSGSNTLSGSGIIPKLNIGNSQLVDRIFGGGEVDLRPAGNIDLTFGGNWQNIDNPILQERLRKTGTFDFQMGINMNIIGNIGDKMKINMNYNTKATFDFENQVKLEYSGQEDEIIQKIEAGNVSLPLNTLLIPGSQSLFGIKTQLKFGRLTVTNVASQNESKAASLTIENGAQTQEFEITADKYEENKHFFLDQNFRSNFNNALGQLPFINSQANVSQIEVWVTNDQGVTEEVRDIVAFMDLGELEPYSNQIQPLTNTYPANNSNDLYGKLYNSQAARSLDQVNNELNGPNFNLEEGRDFIVTRARKLRPNEFNYDPQLGYISVNLNLQSDQILAVAYQYTINDDPNNNINQVGEFGADLPIDQDNDNVLFLKMLKNTTFNPTLPLWDLMMKNIYPLGAYQVEREDFRLNVYYQKPGGGEIRYLPSTDAGVERVPLIRLLNLDNLNSLNDPQPDGVFDYVEGVTMMSRNGRLIFPVLEPFGDDLRSQFDTAQEAETYVYDELYDSTRTIALQFPEFNRFLISGSYKSKVSSNISLGSFNLPPGSVTVKQGGQQLQENVHYTINYSLGQLTIIDDAILQSGVPVTVNFEDNELFGFNKKSLVGTRLDYWINDDFTLGGTWMRLAERPFTQKVNFGDDPITNNILGLDANYYKDAPGITRFIDKLPGIDTKEPSSISLRAEGARLIPGHSKAITDEGEVYIDDFEGTKNEYDMKFPFTSWVLASTPRNATNAFGLNLFPEAELTNDLAYGENRARLNWYNIDPVFLRGSSNGPATSDASRFDPYVIEVLETDVFPFKQTGTATTPLLTTFNLSYYPEERGPYNFRTDDISSNGSLESPEDSWGGIMRRVDYNDFEQANIEFIEFWMLDPFLNNPGSQGGDLYFNLGEISEDILKDNRHFFENGLPGPTSQIPTNQSEWGFQPTTQVLTNTFDNDNATRLVQDVGFDGMTNDQERDIHSDFLSTIQSVVDPGTYAELEEDPSSDDYRYYRDDAFDQDPSVSILERYKDYNGPDGNSPEQVGNNVFSNASNNTPDTEDINRDNTLNRNEAYFQYRVPLRPGMEVGESYITDIQIDTSVVGGIDTMRWYHFKIPIEEYTSRSGAISDFRSIRFMRMFLSDFQHNVNMRFATLDLVRNQWRRYQFSLKQPGEFNPTVSSDDAFFNVTSVSLDENSTREPVPYTLPPGVEQEQIVGAIVDNTFQNEQSLALQVCGLQDGDSRAVFKNLELDMRQFKRLKMWVHAETSLNSPTQVLDGETSAFIRIGSDFVSNYYEYELPLSITDPVSATTDDDLLPFLVWPDSNIIDIRLDSLVRIKRNRNAANAPLTSPYSEVAYGNSKITIVGTPDLGKVKNIMLGIRNPKNDVTGFDDGLDKCVEVWFNELRLSQFDESGGYAAVATADIKLADLGNLTVSGNMHTSGFGTLQQKVGDRYRDNYYQGNAALAVDLGKFLPEKAGIKLPVRADYTRSTSNPEYDPYETDIIFKDKVETVRVAQGDAAADSTRRAAQDFNEIKSINITNARKIKTNPESKNRIYDISNWNATYAYTERNSRDEIIESEQETNHFGSLGYNFNTQPKYITPFKNVIKSNNKYFKLIKELNFNVVPSTLTFRTDLNRDFEETKLRQLIKDDFEIDPTYTKQFNWGRFYGFKHDFTKNLTADYSAGNLARIDEPEGRIDSDIKKDSIRTSLRELGRTTLYNQSTNVRYKLPLDKFPLTDWIEIRAQYGTDYDWTVGPFATVDTINLGNTVANSQNITLNNEFRMTKLYDKSKFLKKYNRQVKRMTQQEKDAEKKANDRIDNEWEKQEKKWEEEYADWVENGSVADTKPEKKRVVKKAVLGKKKRKPRQLEAAFIKPLLSLKRVSVNLTDNKSTVLPGFNFAPQYIGQNWDQNAPGLDFIFGYQPDYDWMGNAAVKGWITEDTRQNFQFIQNWRQTGTLRASFEPYQNLRLDVSMNRTVSKNHTEYFKVIEAGQGFQHITPVDVASFSISYLPIRTMFDVFNEETNLTDAFQQMEVNRTIIADRLGINNPDSNGEFFDYQDSISLADYRSGYGPYSQDVIIPSFIAAYTGTDAKDVKLNSFKTLPLPNWRLTYNGLSKMEMFKKYFSNFNITHGYNSSFNVNSLTSNLNFEGDVLGDNDWLDPIDFANPYFIDTLSGNYYSLYNIPQVVISEQFSPLIGIDMTFKNGITSKFEYKKSRNMGMSLIDYRLNESRSEEFVVGAGYRMKGFPIPFKIKGVKKKLENDLNFRLDFSYRDNFVLNQQLDQGLGELVNGMTTWRLSPTIDYVVNNRLNVRLFYDRSVNKPRNSASYPITTTKAGVRITFTLAN